MDFENGQLSQMMAQQQTGLRVCFLDIEKVMTLTHMTGDVIGTQYSSEAIRCLTSLCTQPINMKLIFISRAVLARSENTFYLLERCHVQDKWLYPDWTLEGLTTLSKRDAVLTGLRRLPVGAVACVLDDEQASIGSVPIPVFVPDDGYGLTQDLARRIANHFDMAQEFDRIYQSIPARSVPVRRMRLQIPPDMLA